jgi:hypothetical protein
VPLIAQSLGGRAASAHVLVVVPALTWQGANPVDDDGSGLPATLGSGQQIALNRPLIAGMPADFPDQVGLLSYLDSQHYNYQLTSDLALAEGSGPQLAGHSGVILDGPMLWLPAALAARLHAYVQGGGRVLSLGIASLGSVAHVAAVRGGLIAGPAVPLTPDPFGAKHGQFTTTGGQLITVVADHLGVFGTTVAFSGFNAYQAIFPPAGTVGSLAGVAASAPAVAAFRLGSGDVVEVGLPKFGASLGNNVDARELTSHVWQLLTR